MLQRGGVGQQSWIAADDKDTEPCFTRMARLASTIIFKHYKAQGGSIGYTDQELKAIEEAIPGALEDWVDSLFDVEAKLEAE